MTCFNPLDKFYKSITGAVCANKKITFRVKGDFNSVVLLLKKDGGKDDFYPLNNKGGYFEVTLSVDVGLYFYCFSLGNGKFIGIGDDYLGTITENPERFQLTAYSKNYKVPDFMQGGIIYQIFPDRFYSSNKNKEIEKGKILHKNWLDMPEYKPNEFGKIVNNDFFGGDLNGITEKLEYLKDLGVTVIYLNPIFKAYSNHRYDTGDYMSIDPLLGCEADLINLINKADEHGIKIILDGVFNHTGDDSIYFNKYGNHHSIGAYQSKNSKYYGWYNFEKFPDKYESWWGITVLPSVNENNQSYIDFISGKDGVLEHYTKLGIGGWRLDVVDELPTEFVRSIRKAVKDVNPNAIVIGEVWEDASNKVSYDVRREYFQGAELDSVMNYPLKDAIINFILTKDVGQLSFTIKTLIDHYPQQVLHSLMNMLSTHDTYRLISAVCGYNTAGLTKEQLANLYIDEHHLPHAKFLVRVASLLQYTLCGVPSLYYGDEIGMQGYSDPLNRKCYPWGQEDKELLSWFKFLGTLRHDYDAFIDGDFCELYADDGAFVYQRIGKTSEVLIAVNLSNNELHVEFDGELTNLIDGKNYFNSYQLKSNTFAVFIKK